MFPRVVVQADPAPHLRGVCGHLVVVICELLRVVVDRLRRGARFASPSCRPGASGREVAAAGADDEVVAEGHVEFARLLELLRVVGPLLGVKAVFGARDMRADGLYAGVGQSLAEPLGVFLILVVAGELHALVADCRDILERTVETGAILDVVLDGVELQRNLGLHAAATASVAAASGECRSSRAGSQKLKEPSACHIRFHVVSPCLNLSSPVPQNSHPLRMYGLTSAFAFALSNVCVAESQTSLPGTRCAMQPTRMPSICGTQYSTSAKQREWVCS